MRHQRYDRYAREKAKRALAIRLSHQRTNYTGWLTPTGAFLQGTGIGGHSETIYEHGHHTSKWLKGKLPSRPTVLNKTFWSGRHPKYDELDEQHNDEVSTIQNAGYMRLHDDGGSEISVECRPDQVSLVLRFFERNGEPRIKSLHLGLWQPGGKHTVRHVNL